MIKIGIFNFFKKEERAEEVPADDGFHGADSQLLKALLNIGVVTKETALAIPTVNACIGFIADMITMLPIKLYDKSDGTKKEVENDPRIFLLNDDTKDTLDASQFWSALVADYFLGKGGYAYINKFGSDYSSLHYVDEECVAIHKNVDPIFKTYKILVNGKPYRPDQFIKILRNTKDGSSGKSIIDELSVILNVGYNTLVFENALVAKGGNKRGFVKSQRKLSDEAINRLKSAWQKMYSNNSENVVILNDGLEFQEASNSSVEMQLNENKEANSNDFCRIFKMPESVLRGNASLDDHVVAFKQAVLPVIKVIETALNRDFLLESEKQTMYWAFDTKEATKGDIKTRYEAYKMGIEANFLQVDEVRYKEDEPALGFDFIKLGLDSVLYDVKTKEFYTPNTDKVNSFSKLKGGNNIES